MWSNLNFWVLEENNTCIKAWGSFPEHQEGRQKPKAWDGWSGSLTFIQVCVNSLLTLQGGFQMSGHNHHIWWVTCCCPRRKKPICSFRGTHLERRVSSGHCSHLVPPLRATQVPFPQPCQGRRCLSPVLTLQRSSQLGWVEMLPLPGQSRAWGAPAPPRGLLDM